MRAWSILLLLCATGADGAFGSSPWETWIEEAEAEHEIALANWFRQWRRIDRPDRQILAFPTEDYHSPTVTEVGSRLWMASTAQRRRDAKDLIDSAREAATENDGYRAYRLLWQAHRCDPTDHKVRAQLGIEGILKPPSIQEGARAVPEIQWPTKSYQEIATAHFRILTRADKTQAKLLAIDLERALAVWRQALTPLWITNAALVEGIEKGRTPLARAGPPLRVVLLGSRAEYLQLLQPLIPGIEQSTGYYAPRWNMTFLYLGDQADAATRYHELTHQFLQEASRFRMTQGAGRAGGFWVVEGIACYFESLRWQPTYAILGGWESPRLQTARYRWLQQGHRRELQEMNSVKQSEVASMTDLAMWYTDATAYVHWFLDGKDDSRKEALLRHIDSVYRRGSDPQWVAGVNSDELVRFLRVTNEQLGSLQDTAIRVGKELVEPSIKELCLGGSPITENGLLGLPQLPNVQWFDAAGLPLSDSMLDRILGNSCQRLNLERTQVTDGIDKVLARQTKLSELDLSSTRCGDPAVAALSPGTNLKTLWLTGSQVTDQSIELLCSFGRLRQLDLQKTPVTEVGMNRLRQRLQAVEINPLAIQTSPR